MSLVEELLERNERIAAGAGGELPPLPRLRLVVLACMDHRVDPALIFGFELGDAVVIRNPGGRVTPSFVQDLAVLARVFPQVEHDDQPFELMLIQHTECGFARLSALPEHAELVADYFGVPTDRLAERAVTDPRVGIESDLALLAEDARVPGSLSVSGLVYDLGRRRAELVERRSPLRGGDYN